MPPKDPVAAAKAAGLRYVQAGGPGIARMRNGEDFQYTGPDGKVITDEETLGRIRSLAIPPAWTDVWICPLASGHLQAIGRDQKGRKQYRYHPLYRSIRDHGKYNRMTEFGKVLPKIRAAVNQNLKLPGLPKRKVLAACVKLLETTGIRVGNEEYAKTNKSYGLTTLKDKHVDIDGSSVRFQFRGKSGQDWDIELQDRRLAKIVQQCRDIPGQDLFQYKDESGEYAKVTSGDVNEYLREITGEDFTAKDFRTWAGTGQTALALLEIGASTGITEAKKNITEAVKKAAEKLGNRPATCRNYYVHPAVLESYVEGTLAEAMQQADGSVSVSVELSATEECLLNLVTAYDLGKPRSETVITRLFGSRKKAS